MSNEAALKELERKEEVWEEKHYEVIRDFGATSIFMRSLTKGLSNDYTEAFWEHIQCLDPETLTDLIKASLEGKAMIDLLAPHANTFADDLARNVANQHL